MDNLYVHFPFCRRRCSYCTLYSRVGASESEREAYVRRLADDIRRASLAEGGLKTVYFGGGSPGFCDLSPVLAALRPLLADDCEFTVELHPLDVNAALLATLAEGGVNRISMGLQSLDDGILAHMGRGYSFMEAERAFRQIRDRFDNAGIDLIVGYPGESAALTPRHARLAKWGLRHCSVYSLQNERGLANAVDDETVLDRIAVTAAFLKDIGLERYEISNYAAPGYACRHNLSVWRGEDYCGLGDGACGRIGLTRTTCHGGKLKTEEVDPETDLKERTMFRLRTREGVDASRFADWPAILDRHVAEGLLTREGEVYTLTSRGTEVCDSILADLI